MGLSLDEFYDLTWSQYTFLKLGYERRIERQLDNTRHIISAILSPHRKKNAPPIKPKDIMPLYHLDNDGVNVGVTKKVSINNIQKLKDVAGI